MNEERKYFRIKNEGEMCAFIKNQSLEIEDLSAKSISIITDIELPTTGTLELKINLFAINMQYQYLRTNPDHTIILLFKQRHQINKLFCVLKNLRDSRFNERSLPI